MLKTLKACIIRILNADGDIEGTGFVISDDKAVTCAHIIENAGSSPGETVKIAFALTGDSCTAEVLVDAWRPSLEEDIAFLNIQAQLPAGVVPAIIGESSNVFRHSFVSFGYPKVGNLEGIYAEGDILGVVNDAQGIEMLQLRSQEVAPGMSGAPVFDMDLAYIVGMLTSTYNPDATLKFRDTAFATPCEAIASVLPSLSLTSAIPLNDRYEDWGQALDVENYYGRQAEFLKVKEWIVSHHCRVVGVFGMGGIGKTAFTTKLARQIRPQFNKVIWRSLRDAPPIEEILDDWLQFLPKKPENRLPEGIDRKISLLLKILKNQHNLLLLDNAETILCAKDMTGRYRSGYEGYGRLIQRIGETGHSSCLVLTSREKPKEFSLLENRTSPVRSVYLKGIEQAEVQEMLKERDIFGSTQAWAKLITSCSGNPMALKMISVNIQDHFEGNIDRFLDEEELMLVDIHHMLKNQFERFSPLELDIMSWLAIGREPISLRELAQDLAQPRSKREIIEALNALQRRSMVEKGNLGAVYTQPSVVMEYATDCLIVQFCSEISSGNLQLVLSHAIMKAQAKEYIRESQKRLILKPVIDNLLTVVGGRDQLKCHLIQLATVLKERPRGEQRYGGGNILNLLLNSKVEFRCSDFSDLCIRQAYLKGMILQDINFARSDLTDSVFTDTFGAILSLTFNPDGSMLAGGSEDRTIRVWKVNTGQSIATLQGHRGWIWSVAFSPDGAMLASGGEDEDWVVKLWEVNNWSFIRNLRGHTNRIRSVAFSPDGTMLATGSDDKTIKLWNVSCGQCQATLQDFSDWVWQVAFSPDGKLLISSYEDGTIKLWNLNTKKCLHTFHAHSGRVWTGVFSPCGKMIASGGEDHTVKLWDVDSKACIETLSGHTNQIRSVVFSPHGDMLASGSEDQTVKLWKVDSKECIVTLRGHKSPIKSISFSSDGTVFASSGADRTIKIWDVIRKRYLLSLEGYINGIVSLAFNTAGTILAGAESDHSLKLWSLSNGKIIHKLQEQTSRVRSLAFSPDGNLLACGTEDELIKLWDVNSGKCLEAWHAHSGWVWSLAFSPDGSILGSGSEDRTVKLWDLNNMKCLKTMQGHANQVWTVAFSPDGAVISSRSEDQTVRLWQVNSGECLHIIKGHTNWVSAIVFSPDSTKISTFSIDGTIKTWDVRNGKCLLTISHQATMAQRVAFSPNISTFATANDDFTINVWDMLTAKHLATLQGHSGTVKVLMFSPTGNTLAAGIDDGTIWFWDLHLQNRTKTIRSVRPYENMNITGVNGLTQAQKYNLIELGAMEAQK